jgi:hypothetical protein
MASAGDGVCWQHKAQRWPEEKAVVLRRYPKTTTIMRKSWCVNLSKAAAQAVTDYRFRDKEMESDEMRRMRDAVDREMLKGKQ